MTRSPPSGGGALGGARDRQAGSVNIGERRPLRAVRGSTHYRKPDPTELVNLFGGERDSALQAKENIKSPVRARMEGSSPFAPFGLLFSLFRR